MRYVAEPRGDDMAHLHWEQPEDYAIALAAPLAYEILSDLEAAICDGERALTSTMIQRISEYLEQARNTKEVH